MTTVEGLFTAGDGVGGSGHKFSSGSHAEGRIAAKQMVRYAKDFADFKPTLAQSKEELVDLVYKPVRTFLDNWTTPRHRHQPQLHQTRRHDVSPDESHP
jgi:adenylylsulfate reductase subunit A